MVSTTFAGLNGEFALFVLARDENPIGHRTRGAQRRYQVRESAVAKLKVIGKHWVLFVLTFALALVCVVYFVHFMDYERGNVVRAYYALRFAQTYEQVWHH